MSNAFIKNVLMMLGIVRGNPWVKFFNPYPYPPKTLPLLRVGVVRGLGRGFEGYREYKGLVKGKSF